MSFEMWFHLPPFVSAITLGYPERTGRHVAHDDRTSRSSRNWQLSMGALALMVAAAGCRNTGPDGPVEARLQALGSWQHGDLGAPGLAGTWSLSGTTHTLEGSGT